MELPPSGGVVVPRLQNSVKFPGKRRLAAASGLDSDDLSDQGQAAALLGTAMTLTVGIRVIGTGVWIEPIEEVRWFVSRAGQVNPWA
jgi:hypothetical protein